MSQRQIDANRINGAKGGVKTWEGKQISKMNAERHGFTSKKLVLTTEEEPHFNAMLEGYLEELNPQGLEETDLVREVVAGKWRQERYWELETAVMELSLVETNADITNRFDEIDPWPKRRTHSSSNTATSKPSIWSPESKAACAACTRPPAAISPASRPPGPQKMPNQPQSPQSRSSPSQSRTSQSLSAHSFPKKNWHASGKIGTNRNSSSICPTRCPKRTQTVNETVPFQTTTVKGAF